jgi:hypothetical protein
VSPPGAELVFFSDIVGALWSGLSRGLMGKSSALASYRGVAWRRHAHEPPCAVAEFMYIHPASNDTEKRVKSKAFNVDCQKVEILKDIAKSVELHPTPQPTY